MITTIFHIILIVYCYSNFVTSKLYYIASNGNSSDLCSMSLSPCLTISQFADESSNGSSNTTVALIFLPGNHLLNTTISFVNIRQITMISVQVGNSSNVLVTCQRYGLLNYSFVDNIYLSSLEFSKCRHQINSAKKVTIEGCVFQNNTKTVIQLLNSILIISTSSFLANSVDNTDGPIRYASGKVIGSPITATRSYVMISKCKFEKNNAVFGGTIFAQLGTNVVLINSTFLKNYAREQGGVLVVEGGSNVSIIGSNFHKNSAHIDGGMLTLSESNLYVDKSNFTFNYAYNGGVIFANDNDVNVYMIKNSNFSNNSASLFGGVMYIDVVTGSSIGLMHNYFTGNTAELNAAVLFINNHLNITIRDCKFIENLGSTGTFYAYRVNAFFIRCEFINNVATLSGGVALYGQVCKVKIIQCTFAHNYVYNRGVLYFTANSSVEVSSTIFISNTAKQGLAYFITSNIFFTGINVLRENVGSLVFLFSNASFRGHMYLLNETSYSVAYNDTLNFQEGGAITAVQSNIVIEGTCSLVYNRAKNGGAIQSIASKFFFYSILLLKNNTAAEAGGGIYLYQSEIQCIGQSQLRLANNTASMKGGGIFSVSSIITVECNLYWLPGNKAVYSGSKINFISNEAKQTGGAIHLELNSKIQILSIDKCLLTATYILLFNKNTADYGGAVYVADDTNYATCVSKSYKIHSTATECFLQTLTLEKDTNVPSCQNLLFSKNHALVGGSNVFGGLLDRCSQSPFSKTGKFYQQNGLEILTTFSKIGTDSVASHPVRVCFCNGSQPQCSYPPPQIKAKKGETFSLHVVAVDQANHTVNANIHSSLAFNGSGIGEGQLIQHTNKNCTKLIFNVSSPRDSEELILYADGPCKDAEPSRAKVQIRFTPCWCPIGFQQSIQFQTRCVCECDSKIISYINNCDPQTNSLFRKETFWIISFNRSHEYIIYTHCPLDYCHPTGTIVKFNLNLPNGADAQCTNNRTGLLCGSCDSHLSLSLGSSKCLACPRHWQALLIALLFAACIAGIALVALILVLNLTVAIGTLNGVIFYANIINTNRSAFLPFRTSNAITVFISWLNLELGFDTCFFKGMDAYWKTLLQLVFPFYLIILVVMIIIISERSVRFARLIGRRNPVATLTTLILLSYTKLLQLVIATFSFAIINYPDGSRKVVWLLDASVDYLKGKHVALFLAASIVLMIGVFYTTILLCWQWLLYHQNKIFLRWVRHQRLCMFIEPYHAPYTFKHRYWTGLLLLIRAVLYVISVANVSNNPGVNLLVTGITITGLLILKGSQGYRIYKKNFLNLIEIVSYVNIMLLCFCQFYALEGGEHQTTVAYIFGSLSVALFLIIITYHIITDFVSWMKLRKRLGKENNNQDAADSNNERLLELGNQVTHSVVSLPGSSKSSSTSGLKSCDGEQKNVSLETQSESALVKTSLSYQLMKS